MKVIAAVDSFKGSLSSLEAGQAVKDGILRAIPDAQVIVKPVADGGEGTVAALTAGMNGNLVTVTVTGPVGEQVEAQYGIIEEHTAVLEMAMAAGLPLVPENKRNPLYTTTCGVGEMILDALDRGCRRFIIGIGGSATNDGGTGMLTALGFRFLKSDGSSISQDASELEQITRIETAGADERLAECEFQIACDVINPLCGENGASAVFAPQKGADEEIVHKLDDGLRHFAALTARQLQRDCADIPGAGAAGGLGYGFISYLNASLQSGVDLILNTALTAEDLEWADIVVTGEGRLDAQTEMGKAPYGIAKRAKEHGCLVIALAGSVEENGTQDVRSDPLNSVMDARFSIQQGPISLKEAMQPEITYRNMCSTISQIFSYTEALLCKLFKN